MKLTREEAINRHRIMWRWIGEESLRHKRALSKANAFVHFGWKPISNSCWLCEYVVGYLIDNKPLMLKNGQSIYDCKSYCPLKWPKERCYKCIGLSGHLFDEFVYYKNIDNYEKSASIALQIAELKERW